jgi:hypothetical protein
MKTRSRVLETDVAKQVIAYLSDLRWEVFQEVTGQQGRADIVARQGSIIWIIETKTTFGLPVIEQARRWIPHAHRVSVGTPRYPGQFAQEVCRNFGIGIICSGRDARDVSEPLNPRLNRKPWKMPKLCEEHKTYAEAGTNGGGYFTPFRRTIRIIEDLMREHPQGIKMKDLVDQVDHHYASNSSARQHLSKWLIGGHIPGYGIRQEGRNNIVVRLEAIPC